VNSWDSGFLNPSLTPGQSTGGADISAQLSQLIQAGDYAGAFRLADSSGQMSLLTDPTSLAKLAGPNGIPQAKYGAFIQAFAPYESKLTGQKDTTAHGDAGIGTEVWSQNDNLSQRTQNAISESSNMLTAENQFGLTPQKTLSQQLAGNGDFKQSSGGGKGAINGVSGLAANVPDLSSIFGEVQGNSTWDNALPAVAALGVIGGAAAIGYAGAAGAAGAAGETAGGVAPVTDASLSYGTGSLTAENVAGGTLGGSLSTDVAGTLGDVTVTAGAGGGGLTAGDALGAASIAGSAAALPSSSALDNPSIAPQQMPHANVPSQGLSRYLPKNVISNYLQDQGAPKLAGDAIGGAVQGAGTSAIRGGNPLLGAVSGGVGGGVGDLTGSGVAGSVAGTLTAGALAPQGSTMPQAQVSQNPWTAQGGSPAPVGATGPGGASVNGGPTTVTPGDPSSANPADPSLLNSLFGSGGIGVPLTELGAAMWGANQQKNQNNAMAGQLNAVGQPLVNAGMGELTAAQTGFLNPQTQNLQNSQLSQGNTLVGQAGPLLNIANTAFQQFQSGTLPQWQQAELDQQKAAAYQQAVQSLGAQADSSTLAQVKAQIDQQYDMAKGNLMQQNLSTGENAYTLGEDTQNMGYKDIQAGWQTGVTAIQQSFSNAISLATAGYGPIQDAIQLQIQGNTQLTNSLMEMMGLIGMGYARDNAGKKTTGAQSLLSQAGSGLKSLFGGGGSSITNGAELGGSSNYTGGWTDSGSTYVNDPTDFNDPSNWGSAAADTGSSDALGWL
jgi:hypothetical protein